MEYQYVNWFSIKAYYKGNSKEHSSDSLDSFEIHAQKDLIKWLGKWNILTFVSRDPTYTSCVSGTGSSYTK